MRSRWQPRHRLGSTGSARCQGIYSRLHRLQNLEKQSESKPRFMDMCSRENDLTVGVEHLRDEPHSRWLVGIIFREVQRKLECPCIGPHDCGQSSKSRNGVVKPVASALNSSRVLNAKPGFRHHTNERHTSIPRSIVWPVTTIKRVPRSRCE